MTTEFMRGMTDKLPSSEDVLSAIGLQYERPGMTAFNTVAAFALGALVGAVLTALYAPRPGAEMRQEVSDRVRQLGERMGWSDRRAGAGEAAAH